MSMRWFWALLTILLTLLVLLAVPYGAWAGEHRRNDLEAWTVRWQVHMGLPRLQPTFAPEIWIDGVEVCGHTAYPSGVVYSLSKKCSKLFTAREVALHEACHYRMQHHAGSDLSVEQRETEARTCAAWYR
jgi:hypothetical protein